MKHKILTYLNTFGQVKTANFGHINIFLFCLFDTRGFAFLVSGPRAVFILFFELHLCICIYIYFIYLLIYLCLFIIYKSIYNMPLTKQLNYYWTVNNWTELFNKKTVKSADLPTFLVSVIFPGRYPKLRHSGNRVKLSAGPAEWPKK